MRGISGTRAINPQQRLCWRLTAPGSLTPHTRPLEPSHQGSELALAFVDHILCTVRYSRLLSLVCSLFGCRLDSHVHIHVVQRQILFIILLPIFKLVMAFLAECKSRKEGNCRSLRLNCFAMVQNPIASIEVWC